MSTRSRYLLQQAILIFILRNPMLCRRISSLLVLTYLLLSYSILAQESEPVSSLADSTDQEDHHHGGVDAAEELSPKESGSEKEENTFRSGKWGTGGALGDSSEDNPQRANVSSIVEVELAGGDFHPEGASNPSAEATAKPNSEELKNETGTKRHWGQRGQMLKPTKETEDAPDSTSPQLGNLAPNTRHIPIINKHQDGTGSGAFPEGFKLSARVFTGQDGLAYFDSDEDISLPYVYCGADGSTTSALAVHTAIFREAIAAPTVWNTGDMRPTLAVALRSFRIKLDSGEEQVFQPGDVVLLEDTIRSGHQMVVSDHRDLVVMFVTLQRKHHDIGQENLSIKRASLQRRSCADSKANDPKNITTRLQSLEWDGRRARTIILGVVSLSLSTLAADFLAKTAPLWLAVGIGGSVFVAGATYGLTVVMESVLTKLHLGAIRRSFDVRTNSESNDSQ